MKIDYKKKTVPDIEIDDVGSIYDKLIETMLYDALEDIERGMKEGYVKSAEDISPEDMFEMVYEMFETDSYTYFRDQFVNKLEEMI